MNVDSILQEIGAMKTKMNKKEKIVKTPEEAIETIKSNMPTSGYQMLRESLIMAIGALEKQIPKKAEIYTDTIQTMSASINRDVYLCPVCGEFICNVEDELPNYCSYCGQAIDNENLEEMEDEKD